jgi:tetratricopeptide (TPR) repeat protein
MTEVFISYRVRDERFGAAAVYEILVQRFGANRVFRDCVSLRPGEHYPSVIRNALERSTVLLAIIGPEWLALLDGEGRVIDRNGDWVRREIATAFSRGIPIIPVLLENTAQPSAVDLPAEINQLAFLQAARVAHETFGEDVQRLATRLAGLVPGLAAAAPLGAPSRFLGSSRLDGYDTPTATPRVPASLPPDVVDFTGRREPLAWLRSLLDVDGGDRRGPVVITGPPGVGKTALAVHWSHQVRRRFPDGQLYLNLRGFDSAGHVMPPDEAIRALLDNLNVPPDQIPPGLEAQAALYRGLLDGRRVLVLLDNASDAEQVRPLLPGTPTALVLVTSRNQLTSLVAVDGAQPLALDLLSPDEARELLARRLGADRVTAEPAAVEEIITRCARLPLALAIVAARGAQSGFALSALAAELTEAGGPLDALDAGDPVSEVRAVFSWSYTALTPAAARLFRLLGLHPGPDVSPAAAASLAGLPRLHTRRLLIELARASLVAEHTPHRYTFHDLLRAYVTDLTHTHDPDRHRHTALGRLLDHYLHTAHSAACLLHPARDPIALALAAPATGVLPEQPADHRSATAWLKAEHPVLLTLVLPARAAGFDAHAWQLAWTVDTYLDRRGRWHHLGNLWSAALAAADRLEDPVAQAYAHRRLGWAHLQLGSYQNAENSLQRSLELCAVVGDHAGQAHTHDHFAYLWERQGRPDQALEHAELTLSLFRAADHPRGEAVALNAVGWYHALLGEHRQALTRCQEALALLQKLGDREGEAATWDSLGYVHHELGDFTQAAYSYEHAYNLYREIGNRYEEADTLTHLGDTHQAAGDLSAARDAWQQALTILADLKHPDTAVLRAKLGGALEPHH